MAADIAVNTGTSSNGASGFVSTIVSMGLGLSTLVSGASAMPAARDQEQRPDVLHSLVDHFFKPASPGNAPNMDAPAKPSGSEIAAAQALNQAVLLLHNAKPLIAPQADRATTAPVTKIGEQATARVEAANTIRAAMTQQTAQPENAAQKTSVAGTVAAGGIRALATGVADAFVPVFSLGTGIAAVAQGVSTLATAASSGSGSFDNGKGSKRAKNQVDMILSSGPGFGPAPTASTAPPAPDLARIETGSYVLGTSGAKFDKLGVEKIMQYNQIVADSVNKYLKVGVAATADNAAILGFERARQSFAQASNTFKVA